MTIFDILIRYFLKYILPKIIIILLLSIFFTACNTTKYVKENEYLLSKNTIKIDDKKTSDYVYTDYLIQRPNNKPLGIPVGLMIYNLGDSNYDSIFYDKIEKFENRKNIKDRLFSKKQTFKNIIRRKNVNKWLLNKGEKPVVVDDKKTNRTAEILRNHFFNKGYFNTSVKPEVVTNDKKAEVTYQITKKDPFFIGEINYYTDSYQVDSIIKNKPNLISIKRGQQYNYDNIIRTVKSLTKELRNNGFYDFNESLISFKNIDTLAKNNITPVDIHVSNRLIKKENEFIELPTNIQRIKKISVYTDYSYEHRNKSYENKIRYDSIDYYSHNKLKHKLKTLTNSIFIEPNKIFSAADVESTRKHLTSLNNFKIVNISQIELPNNELETVIKLTPLKKYGVGINTEVIHSNIKQIGLSGGFSFIDRNIFKGAEVFKLSLQGSIFNTAASAGNADDTGFNAYEVGIDASLEFPKFIFPFMSNVIPRDMIPKTKISIGTSLQENIGLDKQKVTGAIDYNWNSSKKDKHIIELVNVQFVRNLNVNSYFEVYSSQYNQIKKIQEQYFPNYDLNTANADEFLKININHAFENSNSDEYNTLINIENRREIIISNNIIPAASYAYEHNSKQSLSDRRYSYFKAKVTSAGNSSSFLFETKEGQKIFKEIPVSQFVKFDIDYRRFWSQFKNNSLAFRAFVGIAIPTGENEDIPFISSYFAGGSNDIRAWHTYELGPGSSNTGLEFNTGNLKILSSLEYRFKVFNSINGAIFIDAGNIWNLPNSSSTATDKELFSSFSSLENIALGSGLGFRYDFSFLVLRMDLAFKTYEPYLTKNNKWFSNYTFKESILNVGINYPF